MIKSGSKKMRFTMRRIITHGLLLLLFLQCLFMTSCHYKEFEDSAKEKIEGLFTQPEESDTVSSGYWVNSAENVMKMGETVSEKFERSPELGEMQYIIHHVQVFDSFTKAGVQYEDFEEISYSSIKEDGSIIPTKRLILLDVTVKNIDRMSLEKNGCEYLINSVSIRFKDKNSTKVFPLLSSQIAYFSAHPPQTETSTDYYHYLLPKGEQKDFQVGWLVEVDWLKDYVPLASIGVSIHSLKYVDLELEGMRYD